MPGLQCTLDHPILATRHLRLRELSSSDIVDLQTSWAGGRQHVASEQRVASAEDVAIQAPATVRLNDSSLHWAVCRLDTDELLGYVCLQDLDLDHSQAELRFWMDPGPGWVQQAVEAGRAVLAYAFGSLSLVTLHAFSACGHQSAYDALMRIGLRPLESNSGARKSWECCPEVQVWNVARYRWMRSIGM